MKTNWKKHIRILGMAALLSLCLTACGREEKPDQKADTADINEPDREEGNLDPEPAGQPEDTEGKDPEDTENSREPDTSQAAEESLTGDIREVGDGTFTVVKAIGEEAENGGEILAVPAGDDPAEDTDWITVAYDENTVFEKQTIWDGGARHEEAEGSAGDLEKGRAAVMQGHYEGQVFYAAKIRVVEVVL